MTAEGNKSKHTRGQHERYLVWTRQNNVQIYGKFGLRHSDERTTRYKTRKVVHFYICLSVRRFVEGKICRKFAYCFVQSILNSVHCIYTVSIYYIQHCTKCMSIPLRQVQNMQQSIILALYNVCINYFQHCTKCVCLFHVTVYKVWVNSVTPSRYTMCNQLLLVLYKACIHYFQHYTKHA